jgi:hypothetical protein
MKHWCQAVRVSFGRILKISLARRTSNRIYGAQAQDYRQVKGQEKFPVPLRHGYQIIYQISHGRSS